MGNSQISMDLRRERVKAMLLDGYGVAQIAKALEVSEYTVRQDLKAIDQKALLARGTDVVDVAFSRFKTEVEWAAEEARKMHMGSLTSVDSAADDVVSGGRMDCLRFIVEMEEKKMGMAQSLGLLEKMAEKKKIDFGIDDSKLSPEMIKKIADRIAVEES